MFRPVDSFPRHYLPHMHIDHLFEPLSVRGTSIPNRVFVSPMCQYSSTNGFANDWHFVHLASRAIGGAGLVMTEAAAVLPEGRITYADLGIWNDDQVDGLRRAASAVAEHGSVPAIQLAHAGRKAGTQRPWEQAPLAEDQKWEPVSSTGRAFGEGWAAPRALSTLEVHEIADAFAAAAARALMAGFQVVEIHAAHGYLLHQFLSPLANDRTDEYGGSRDNRARLLLETTRAVRVAVGDDVPVFVRVSATDWLEDGWTIDDTVWLSGELASAGADFLDCSSGGIVPGVSIPAGPGYQVELAAAVKRSGNLLSGAVGMITGAEQADSIIRSGQADAVLLARELLRNPYWPQHAARALGHEPPVPPQYARAW
jgi:2,4-dienoyl-CoA reductase-like NADH-dependent reductase (Old Yellow Enzyme family)